MSLLAAGAVFACALANAGPVETLPPSEPIIAVGIAHRVRKLALRPEGRFSLIDQSTGIMEQLEPGREYTVEGDSRGRVVFGPYLFMGTTRLLPGKAAEFVIIGERRFSGNLVFQANPDKTVTVIDELGIEDYLRGVLPKEMSPDWPMEALKAQAVVSRTFALNNLGKYSASGYDLSDDAHSQMYSGLTVQSVRVDKAVRATRGQVLSYRGERIPAYFHSCCGGHTTDPAAVWGGANKTPRPLRGVADRSCRDSPHFRWRAYFRLSDILRVLQKRGWNAARLEDMRPGRRSGSGWLSDLRIKVDGAWKRIGANTLRLWLGPQQLKSAKITAIKRRKKGFEFFGGGYGHGVGLCQWGARAQADEGKRYPAILESYFPGAELEESSP